jgi:hypothetical protein
MLKQTIKWKFGLVLAGSVIVVAASGQDGVQSWNPISDRRPVERIDINAREQYALAIRRTADMAHDPEVSSMARNRGLDVLNLTWEDTARYKNSSVGENISDMTIQVGYAPGQPTPEAKCMPVIRYPNFTDTSCDLDPSDFTLLVGNEKGMPLRRVSLREFLETPADFLSNPHSWLGTHHSLIASRDSHVLVSAQACFLPIPREGRATFNPVLFNYQSSSGDPAVLTVLATREGTSTTVIDNKRDSFAEGSTWGQRLFHNNDGQRASLTGERLSEFRPSSGEVSKGAGLSMVLLIQIPLKHHSLNRFEAVPAPSGDFGAAGGFGGGGFGAAAKKRSDVESAVIGHGEDEGDFTEVDDLAIQRDPNLPVRVTVQFYKATSNGVVSEQDMSQIKHEIDRVYEKGENVGSLVTDGETGRPTEYYGCKVQPREWWTQFWQRYEENTGIDREEATARLRHLLGSDYLRHPVSELYLRDLLYRPH